jgi:23S rRNA (pseudouridine1915-N3)-methyltransferase
MKIALLQIGKTSEKYISDGADLFTSRIRKYIPFEVITLPDLRNTRNMPPQEQRLREGERIIRSFTVDDFKIVLDENGREYSTFEF